MGAFGIRGSLLALAIGFISGCPLCCILLGSMRGGDDQFPDNSSSWTGNIGLSRGHEEKEKAVDESI